MAQANRLRQGGVNRQKLPEIPGHGSGREGGQAGPAEAGLDVMPPAELDRLLLEHLPTVEYLARQIRAQALQHVELELDDLVSAGMVGLIDAYSKFDHGNEVQFKSKAEFRIRGAILDWLRTQDLSPRELRHEGTAVEEAIRTPTQRLGHATVEQEIVPEMMVGSSTEVSERLHRTAAPRALAFTFADNDQQFVFEGVFRQMTAFLPQLIRQRQSDALEKIVGALLPEIAISDAALAEARMMVDAKSTILRSGDFLPAGKIAKMAGYSSINPSAQPNKWKRAGNIFAFQHKGIDYFPLYALDPVESYRPYKALAEVLKIFGETKSGWGAAFWFAGLNSFLDDQRPQDLLATRPDLVIAAAQDEVDGVQHG